jgi:CRISPR-associated protein Csd2
VFEYNSSLGSAPSHELFDRIKVQPLGQDKAPRQFADYAVNVRDTDLPGGVILHRLIG